MSVNIAFTGFGPGAQGWFAGLEQDNSRAYFETHRALWEAEVRTPLEHLLGEAAALVGGSARLFRQQRDTRFARDKRPYKTTSYGVVEVPGSGAGLYAELSAGGFFAATGYYQMARDQVQRFRQAAAADGSGDELAALVARAEAAGLKVGGSGVATVPKGHARNHPRLRFIRLAELIVGATLHDPEAIASRAAFDHALWAWRSAQPLAHWLDRHVGASLVPPEQRWARAGA